MDSQEPRARSVLQRLRDAGHLAYYAGGCVRDMLLNRPPKDYDIATDATPDEITSLFERTLVVGKAFGVVTVLIDGHPFEVATFRRDLEYGDGRHPDGVDYATPEEDAQRRDFTINGLFYDPVESHVLDYVGGQPDLARKLVRTIGSPDDRFGEDYLRMLRAVRLSATLEFSIDEVTAAAIRRLAPRVADVSLERVQQELTRLLLEAPRAGDGLRLMLELGLLHVVLPEVAALADQPQPPEFHPEGDVFTHTVLMLNAMEDPTLHLAYAVLLHDIAKPATALERTSRNGETRLRFDQHAQRGAGMAEEVLRRLRLPFKDIQAIVYCVGNHMRFMHVQEMRKATLRRLIGAPTFPVELELHRLDCLASHGSLENYEFLEAFMRELDSEPVLPERWITGRDIMGLGVSAGPEVGRWLREAYDAQMEGRFADREQLLTWLRARLAQVDSET